MKKILLWNSLIALALLLCTGCASIVDSGKKKVQINTNPPGAKVTISDGVTTITTNTPATVRLGRYKGYFKGQDYTVSLEKEGYYPSELEIHPRLDGWYIGNILFGGAIGLIIVDPLTGCMWTLSPRHIDWNLIPTSENLTPEQLKAAEAAANPPKKSSSKKEDTKDNPSSKPKSD